MRHFGYPPWVPTFDIDPSPQSRSDRDGVGLGFGEIASVKPTPSSERSRDGCRVYQVTPRRAPLRRQASRGHRPSAWRPKNAQGRLPKFSKLDALSPYRPGSALLLSPKGMAPQHASAQNRQNLNDGWDDLLCLRKPPWKHSENMVDTSSHWKQAGVPTTALAIGDAVML